MGCGGREEHELGWRRVCTDGSQRRKEMEWGRESVKELTSELVVVLKKPGEAGVERIDGVMWWTALEKKQREPLMLLPGSVPVAGLHSGVRPVPPVLLFLLLFFIFSVLPQI